MSDKKLHICLLVNEFPGLTETFITTKALELSRRGHKVTVVKNQENKLVNTSHLSDVKKAGIEIIKFIEPDTPVKLFKLIISNPFLAIQNISSSAHQFIYNFNQALKLNVLENNNFDIIHAEFSGLGVAYQKALEKVSCVKVVSCRGTAEKVKPLTEPRRKDQLKKLFDTVNAIHCVSQDMADTIKSYCDELSKIFINRPSIDVSVFQRNLPYPEQSDSLHILSIGRFTFQKGYLLGCLAMKKVIESGLKVKWTIVGDGPLMEEMVYHLNALQINESVHLVGKQNRDQILELYNQAHMFLLTSVYEGIANVCLEAMSMELPVVATRSGGMDEVIDDSINGKLCNTYDPQSIADAIIEIGKDNGKRKSMGILARQKVKEAFTIEKQADIFENKYVQLTN